MASAFLLPALLELTALHPLELACEVHDFLRGLLRRAQLAADGGRASAFVAFHRLAHDGDAFVDAREHIAQTGALRRVVREEPRELRNAIVERLKRRVALHQE